MSYDRELADRIRTELNDHEYTEKATSAASRS
jgi:hypothetical protein